MHRHKPSLFYCIRELLFYCCPFDEKKRSGLIYLNFIFYTHTEIPPNGREQPSSIWRNQEESAGRRRRASAPRRRRGHASDCTERPRISDVCQLYNIPTGLQLVNMCTVAEFQLPAVDRRVASAKLFPFRLFCILSFFPIQCVQFF